jgi:hypothetical protein
MQADSLSTLRDDCEVAAKFWGRTFSVLGAITYRERGEAAIGKLWTLLLGQHQQGFYRVGLRKVGIRDDEPPAVAAAKYHYLTNLIGGLTMEYVEESPKKVWIRYTAPMWTYAGAAMLALPSSLRRTIFTGWHPHNGRMMGCPRLGWVSTKFIMEGDPYDEGYFIEYDRDLQPGEEMRYERVRHTPEFDPARAPRLDPARWPEARLLKARRNWSREYVRTTVDCLFQMFGEQVTYFIYQQAMRGLAIQYGHELKRDLRVAGTDVEAVAELFVRLLRACDQQFELERLGPRKYQIALRSSRPFEEDAPEDLRAASFHFHRVLAWMLNGRIAVSRWPQPRAAEPCAELWEIEDTGKWQW